MIRATDRRSDVRLRIVGVAARLLQEQGPAAVTTRAVALAAGVQAPAIYRLFGDKDGLLEAVVEHVVASHVSVKAAGAQAASAEGADPLDDLRAGWQVQIDFGVANPSVFRLLSDPNRVLQSPAIDAGRRVLASRVHRVATSGRLRVSEQRAVGLIQAAGVGAVQTLLATPTELRDIGLADSIYEAVLRHIVTNDPAPRGNAVTAATITVRAGVTQLDILTHPEQQLLAEWLDRVLEHRPNGHL